MDRGATQSAVVQLPVEGGDEPGNSLEAGNGHAELALACPATEAPAALLSLSVVVPATNGPATLTRCLEAIIGADEPPEQLVVVEDPAMGGPGGARNAGARAATGDIIVFVDADVVVHPDVFTRIRTAFDADPGLTALFGSYDAQQGAEGVVSGFRNLLHHHVHQAARGPIYTFWAGLGAIRRGAFEAAGGFDASNPIEDVELGMRLSAGGARLRLDRALQGTHLKAWSLREMVLTDFIVRGAPWVELMIEHRARPNSLNLGWRHRLSALSCLLTVGGVAGRRRALAGPGAIAFITLNRSFYGLLLSRAGPVQASAGIALHAVHHLVAVAAVPAGYVLYLANCTAPQLPIDSAQDVAQAAAVAVNPPTLAAGLS